jgi:AraC family transcriptional regulator
LSINTLRIKQQERLIKVDFTEHQDVKQILPDGLVLSSDRLNWNNLHLKYFRHAAYELPVNSSKQHIIIIHTEITSPIKHELSLDGIERQEELQNGQVVIIPAHTRNSSQWEDRHGNIIISLDPAFYSQHAQSQLNSAQLVPHFSQPDPLIYGIGQALKQELETGQGGGQLYVESAALMLVNHLLRDYSEISTTPQVISEGLPAYQLKYVTEYINVHLAEDISLADLAKQVKLSQSHFSSLFRKSTGLSPYKYLIKQRVNRAKELLLMGNLPIIDVAIAVGFYDQSHLTRHMRRLLGVSPRQLRQQA